jgi:hypothetical protein
MTTVNTRHKIGSAAALVGCVLSLAAAGCGHPSMAGHGSANEPTLGTGNDQSSAVEPSSDVNASFDPADEQQAVSTDGSTREGVSEAPAPPPRVTQPPRADRAPRRPGEAEKVTFDDLNLGMQADVVFRPFMLTDRVKELEGQRVAIAGYMHGGQASQRGIKDFILLKNTQCKFGPGGQADHLANVILREGTSTRFTPSDIRVEGTLKIEPFQGPDGNTWSIYRFEDAQIR